MNTKYQKDDCFIVSSFCVCKVTDVDKFSYVIQMYYFHAQYCASRKSVASEKDLDQYTPCPESVVDKIAKLFDLTIHSASTIINQQLKNK